MEETYPDEFGKVALALTSAQIAKQASVVAEGIGEDLAFNFIGWKEGKLKVITQLNSSLMKEAPIDRLFRCSDMCRTLRAHWEIDAISMIAEGYCSKDIAKTRGLDLAKAFVEQGDAVNECITVTHVEVPVGEIDDSPMVSLVSVPYTYGDKRKVQFGNLSVYPQGAVNVLRDRSYPAMMYKTMNESYYIEETDTNQVVEKLLKMGFHVQVVD